MSIYATLKAELAKPEYAGLSDAEAAAAINAKTVTRKRAVDIGTINAMADGMGLTAKIRTLLRNTNAELAAAHGAENVQQIVGLCYAALGLFDARYNSVDFTDANYEAAYKSVADGLLATGLLASAEQHAAFLAVGNETVKWTLVTLGLPEVHEGEIVQARSI